MPDPDYGRDPFRYSVDRLRFVRYAVFYENPENGILDDVRCLYTCHHDSSADYANSRRSLKISSGFLSGSKLWTGSRKASYDFKIVLPSAVPGILSGVILATGRVVGETAALLFTAGTIAKVAGLMDSGRTLAVHMYALPVKAFI